MQTWPAWRHAFRTLPKNTLLYRQPCPLCCTSRTRPILTPILVFTCKYLTIMEHKESWQRQWGTSSFRNSRCQSRGSVTSFSLSFFLFEEKRKIAHYHQEHLVCQPSLSHHYTVLPTPTKINNIKVTFLLDNLNPKPNISRYFNLDLTIVLAGSYFNQNTVSSQALKLSNLHIVICICIVKRK